MTHVIAVDLGAESGRVARVVFDGARLDAETVHRFANIPVEVRGTVYWDVLRLWNDIRSGIELAAKDASGIGVDCWGVDFALLDEKGDLLANPVHYRDTRTDGMFEWVFNRVPRREVFERTGIQFMILNTLYQLASLVESNSPLLDHADVLLTLPDLFHYWLTGEKSCEFTHATTTQMFNPRLGDWDRELLDKIGAPPGIFAPIIQPGTQKGVYNGIPVFAPGSHDTASAVVAVPTTTKNYAYLSSGTWSLIGIEVTEPVITDESYAANVTNEGGAYGTYRLLKNVMGLWIAQQCRATWAAAGREYTYDELVRLADQAEPFRSLIDPDDGVFLPMGDMPARIREFCQRTGQPIPESEGQVIRAVYESLALKYRHAIHQLEAISGQQIERLHIIGGGVQNRLLCQMTADSLGREVITGPIEATLLGNGIVQLIALGEIGSIGQARELLSQTVATESYEPKNVESWSQAYERFTTLLTTQ